jgi:hypothetical protein
MNREDIIRMAREAASEDGTTRPDKNIVLYAAKTSKFLERFAQLVRAAEREACAKVCEILEAEDESFYAEFSRAKDCAAAIRARGQA